MVVVCLKAQTLRAWGEKVQNLPEKVIPELRLDLLRTLPTPETLTQFLASWHRPILVALHSFQDPKPYVTSLQDLPEVLVDLDLSQGNLQFPPKQTIYSYHGAFSPSLQPLGSSRWVKWAFSDTTLSTLSQHHQWVRSREYPAILLPQEPSLSWYRLLHRVWDYPTTYVALSREDQTSPGQPTWEDYQVHHASHLHPQTALWALIGENLHLSPGPRVYNALACRWDHPFVHVAIPVEAPEAVLALKALGFFRFSITAPLKKQVPVFLGLPPFPINTLWFHEDQWKGENTDRIALRKLLPPLESWLIVGNGAMAEVAGEVIAQRGRASLKVACRREKEAFPFPQIPLTQATSLSPQGVINTSPLYPVLPKTTQYLLDLHHAEEKRVQWWEALRRQGIQVVDGRTFWAYQGAHQFFLLWEKEVSLEDLQEEL